MIRKLFIFLRWIVSLVFWPLQRLTRKPCDALRFTLEKAHPALPKKRELIFDRRPPPMSIRTFQRRIQRALADPWLPCILVEIEKLEMGWSSLQTLHDIVESARKSEKKVVAYLPEGGGIREYYLASAASEIWIAPSAAISLTGLSVESTYLAPALEKLGLRAQVEAVGRYKTAGESLIHRKMTRENEEMLSAILDEIENLVVASVADTRRLGPVTAQQVISHGPYSPTRAIELGLIDGCCYPDQISQKIAPKGRNRARILRWPAYARGRHFMNIFPFGRGRLPVLELKGVLVEGKNKGLKGVVSAKDAIREIRQLKKDPRVPAVVLYVDSRGGTVVASDQIRREIERLGEKKPVIAYMANVAASGGYMISAAAHQIVAQSSTMTGSIGVLAGKVSGRKLLEGLGLHREKLRRGAHAAFDSTSDGWSAGERKAVIAMIEDHYRQFLEVVSRGRRIPIEQVEQSAEGRVWTGRQAKERGLVDHLGGLAEAITAARETSAAAAQALVEPVRPQKPKFPQMLLPKGLAGVVAWASIAESNTAWALEPFELRIY